MERCLIMNTYKVYLLGGHTLTVTAHHHAVEGDEIKFYANALDPIAGIYVAKAGVAAIELRQPIEAQADAESSSINLFGEN
jgi:hypothetical protein